LTADNERAPEAVNDLQMWLFDPDPGGPA